jgi:hypothetical protein
MKTTVNLTIAVVEAEVDTLLRSYPYYPYQRAFSAPSLRQKLIAYVLSRVPSLYAVIEAQVGAEDGLHGDGLHGDGLHGDGLHGDGLHCPPEQQQQVETVIHRGIQVLLLESMPKLTIEMAGYDDLEEMNVGSPSSHWFR